MLKKDIDILELVQIEPVHLLKKKFVYNYQKNYNIVNFELLYYSKNLIFAKLTAYNTINKITFGKLFNCLGLYVPVVYHIDREEYIAQVEKALNCRFSNINSKEFNKRTTTLLRSYMLTHFIKDNYSLFEDIDILISKF
jgi:hypothetical protein